MARVIARPFAGKAGAFARTDRRRDFSVSPPAKTILDYTVEAGLSVKAVGKIEDIFNRKGVTYAVHTHDNMDGIDKTIELLQQPFGGILFTNLVDFDMVYGHRNNAEGYAEALMAFDKRLPEILSALKQDDCLFITADHGCDPTTESTDHCREYTPLLMYGSSVIPGKNLGTRKTFADIAATIGAFLGIEARVSGNSFWKEVSQHAHV